MTPVESRSSHQKRDAGFGVPLLMLHVVSSALPKQTRDSREPPIARGYGDRVRTWAASKALGLPITLAQACLP
jgi:hypothetical protein